MIKLETINKERENRYIYNLKEELQNTKYINNNNINYEIQEQMNTVKKLIKLKGLSNNINIIKRKLYKGRLNITVNSVNEAINLINTKDLFTQVGLNSKEEYTEFEYPFLYKYIQVSANNIEELKTTLNIKDNGDIFINNLVPGVFEVYSIYKSKYCLNYNRKNKQYYISVCKKDYDTNYINFNFIEFYSMVADLSKSEAIKQLLEILNIKVTVIQNKIKFYNKNIDTLQKELVNYPYLYKLTRKHITVLIVLLRLAEERSYNNEDKKTIGDITITVKELSKRINKSSSTITPYLNAFCILGFIEKRPLYTNKEKRNRNDIICYTINSFTKDMLENAEKVAKNIVDNNITLSKINNNNITMLFGKDIAKKIITDKKILLKGVNNDRIYC
ncbi:hypothetical protein PMW00_06300 [Clostridium paraputrificum]|uniref:hypothetical protein n=1 Tax=Clostridium paraputrificum TaxID=29363 RepID=UPI00232EE027|nr:hypothetical protein [Clostridium paraputrificum]MDB2102634.1 hypothetical protein [Clostridium paraputrificum]